MFSSDIDLEEIKRRIDDFRVRAEAGINDAECINEVTGIFGNVYSFPTKMSAYSKGRKFFRARTIGDNEIRIPFPTIRSVSDAWEPPSEFVRVQGRLNAVGQSVLYCCADDPDLAIDEARAREKNHVAVMVYQALRDVRVAVLGDYRNSGLPQDHISHTFYTFLEEEFSRNVPRGQEGRYSISRAIADSFFNYPEQDAWCYRSVQSPHKFNTAFLPGKSRSCLELTGIMICDLRASSPGNLSVKLVVDFDHNTGDARYHLIGSDSQRRIFPEISQSNL